MKAIGPGDASAAALEPRVLEGEVLTGMVRVILLRSPFSLTREEHQVHEGATLAAIIAEFGLRRGCTARVFVDDWLAPEAWWPRVRPHAGHVVTIRAVPMGTSGNGDKSIMGIILGVVLIIVGAVLTYFSGPAWIGLITTGIGMVIGGVVGLLFPPPTPGKFAGLSDNIGGKTSPSLSITGASNQAAPYAPIPKVYGHYRATPPVPAGGVVVTFEDGTAELLLETPLPCADGVLLPCRDRAHGVEDSEHDDDAVSAATTARTS